MNKRVELDPGRAGDIPVALRGVRDALVMIVDDEESLIELTQALLEEAGYSRFVSTADSSTALGMLLRERPDVLLCDINMPGVSGFDILSGMQADPALRYIPVIVLTSADDPETKLRALELGATDFLRKPVDPSELLLRLRNTLAAQAHREHLAQFDHVTGLPNRVRFVDELSRALQLARETGLPGTLLQLGLDRFRQVNEALGPAAGDALLRQAGERIQHNLKAAGGYAAWLGGDEFCVLFPSVGNLADGARRAERLREALALPYALEGRELQVTSSIGVTLFPEDGEDADTLLRNAGAALAEAKEAGRNVCRFSSEVSNLRALQRLSLEAELRKAIEQGELRLFLQPRVHIARQRLSGAEALMYWLRPSGGLVAPDEFVAVAEESGLIAPMCAWALRAACKLNAGWAAQGLPRVPIAVSVSSSQFHQSDFVRVVRTALGSTGQGQFLRLQLEESALMKDPVAAIRVLQELKSLGMTVSIDDFGIGRSSLTHLSRLPLDELRIDRSFLAALRTATDEAVLVDLIIEIAHKLGLSVVAEGVQTREQLRYLATRGCDEIQGHLVSAPLAAEDFTAKFLKGGKASA
jgi:diguanylate cyclase (GGDEF)-like protein